MSGTSAHLVSCTSRLPTLPYTPDQSEAARKAWKAAHGLSPRCDDAGLAALRGCRAAPARRHGWPVAFRADDIAPSLRNDLGDGVGLRMGRMGTSIVFHVLKRASAGEERAQANKQQIAQQVLGLALTTWVGQLAELPGKLAKGRCGFDHPAYR